MRKDTFLCSNKSVKNILFFHDFCLRLIISTPFLNYFQLNVTYIFDECFKGYNNPKFLPEVVDILSLTTQQNNDYSFFLEVTKKECDILTQVFEKLYSFLSRFIYSKTIVIDSNYISININDNNNDNNNNI